jgi:hypothetical protein
MVGKLVSSEVAQQLLSDLVWKLYRIKPSSLTYVIQQVESRKAHMTLRSTERAPTLSARFTRYAGRLLSAHFRAKYVQVTASGTGSYTLTPLATPSIPTDRR